MTFREGNKINYSKKDFSFKPKTKITRQGSTTIRIGPRNKCDFAQPFSIGRGDEIVPKEASNLRGWLRLPRDHQDEEENTISYEQVFFANSRQLGDFTVLLPEVDNWVTHVTNKLVEGDFIITTHICIYEFGYLFQLQRFVRDIFCYYNMILVELHPNRWTTLFIFDKMLRILKMEPSIRVFKHYYTLINSVEREPSIPWFFTFSTTLKGFVKVLSKVNPLM